VPWRGRAATRSLQARQALDLRIRLGLLSARLARSAARIAAQSRADSLEAHTQVLPRSPAFLASCPSRSCEEYSPLCLATFLGCYRRRSRSARGAGRAAAQAASPPVTARACPTARG